MGRRRIAQYKGRPLSETAIDKSELRRYDRIVAKNIHHIFYKYKRLMASKLLSSINISVRKFSSKRRQGLLKDLTAADILLKNNNLNDLVDMDEARVFMRPIRSSSQYWEKRKGDINAMIRQNGPPSFFLTFSPSEVISEIKK